MLAASKDELCALPLDERPRLVVVIDTEEEFDWSKDFSRSNTSVKAMRHIHAVQEVFDRYGITPVYVVDYPIVSHPDGYEPLQEILSSGRCVIGVHLHPWVSPPFREEVNRRNSFPGNLPYDLEAEKLRCLRERIQECFGIRPTIYKAGRYGIGQSTAQILLDQGFEVDLSVCPFMDYSQEGGPDFSGSSYSPYWIVRDRLLEIPLTVGFSGLLRRWGQGVHRLASAPALAPCRPVGVLARLGLVNKVWLSPEGFLSPEHIRLTKDLYADGLRVFSFAFHSPSVVPGHTPYVSSRADLDEFLARCDRYFDFFLGKLGGCPTTPIELKRVFSSVTT